MPRKRVVKKPRRKNRKQKGGSIYEVAEWDPVQKKSVPSTKPYPVFIDGQWSLRTPSSKPLYGSGKVIRY
jgi:hypothetical protein